MPGFPSTIVLALTLCSASVLAPRARADEPAASASADDAEARRAFEAGRDAYDHGAFAAAVAHYERAYALSPRPALLFNLARAADSDGRASQARAAYQRYLEAVPGAENADFVRARIAKMEALESERAAAQPEPAPVAADPRPAPPAAQPAPPLPSVAAATPSVEPPPAAVALARPSPPARDGTPPSRRRRALLWTAVGVVIAGGIAGGALALTRDRGRGRAPGDDYATIPELP